MSGDDRGRKPEVKTGTWVIEHTFMNIRPTGLSDEEVEEEDENLMDAELIRELQSVYYSDVEDQVDQIVKQTENEMVDNKKQTKSG